MARETSEVKPSFYDDDGDEGHEQSSPAPENDSSPPSSGKFIETSDIEKAAKEETSLSPSVDHEPIGDSLCPVRPSTESEATENSRLRRVRFSIRPRDFDDDDDDWSDPPPHRLTWAEKKLLLSARQQSAPAKLTSRHGSLSGDGRSEASGARTAWHALPPVRPTLNGDLQKFIDVETIRQQLTMQRLQQDTLLQRNAILRRQKHFERQRQVTEDNMLKFLHRRRSSANNDILNPPSMRVGLEETPTGPDCPNPNDSKEARIVKERLQRKASGKIAHYVPMCPRVILSNLPPEVRALHRAEMRKRGLVAQNREQSRSAIPSRRKAMTDVR